MPQRSFTRSMAVLTPAAIAAALSFGWSAHGQTIVQGPILNPANAHTYYRFTSSNWTQARNAALALGGDLVTIDDPAENTFVLNIFANAPGSGRVWIGLNDAANEGQFVWSSGQPLNYFNFRPGAPDSGLGIEDYCIMYSGTGLWDNVINLASPSCYGVAEIPGPAAPANDVTPIDVSAGGTFSGTLAGATFTAGGVGASCGGGAANLPDVWYSFIPPAFCPGRLIVSTCGTNDTGGIDAGLNTILSLHSLADLRGEIACNDDAFGDPCGPLDDLNIRDSRITLDIVDTTVVIGIRVSAFNTLPPAPFTLHVSYVPANDECANPATITAGIPFVGCYSHATPSFPNTETGCAGAPLAMNRDLWFRYTPITSGVFYVQSCGGSFDSTLAAYSACPTAPGTALACNSDTPNCTFNDGRGIEVIGTAGTPVLLRFGYTSNAGALPRIWIVCPADFNRSGTVSVQDIFDFLAAYFGGDPRANINGMGGVSVQDIFDFLAAYFGGC